MKNVNVVKTTTVRQSAFQNENKTVSDDNMM